MEKEVVDEEVEVSPDGAEGKNVEARGVAASEDKGGGKEGG